ncbi:MAG: bifunctional oligoribonuclease/PAP phosphatase NrnA [Parcubacteria group bacterium]
MQEHPLFTNIAQSNNILLVCHRKPDGDTIGSATALAFFIFQNTDKKVSISCVDPLPESLGYLNAKKFLITKEDLNISDFDLIIAVDCADEKQAGFPDLFAAPACRQAGLQKESIRIINIDHHKTNSFYADLNIIDPNASSTSEIIFKLFKDNNIAFTKEISTGLMTGIITDTTYFSNAATGKNSMRIASGLMTKQADFKQIVSSTWRKQNLESLKTWGKILSQLEYSEEHKIVAAFITLEDQIEPESLDGISNFLMSLYEPNIIIVIREEKNNVLKCGLRTTKDGIDVSNVAKHFGGGGHQKAAGFSINGKLKQTTKGWTII